MIVQIEGYDRYKVNINGEITFTRNNWQTFKILTPRIGTKYGYKEVRLTDNNGNRNVFNLHRLLAILFIPNPNNLPVVDHIDRNRLNNDISNLRWSTYNNNSFNTKDFENGTFSIGKCTSKDKSSEWFTVTVSLGNGEKRLYIGYSPDINIAMKIRDDFYKDRIKNNLHVPEIIVDYYSSH